MAFRAGQGIIALTLDTAGLSGATSRVSSALKGIEVAAGAAITAIAGLEAAIAVKAVKAFIQQEDAANRLSSVLKATGEAAGFTAKQLEQQATSLEQMTRFSDDAITSMQVLLSTSKNLSGDQFVRAEKAALDLATAMGTDLSAAAEKLGRVLEQPAENLTLLRRAGIQFTDEQETMIKSFVELGDIISAQNIILDELNSRIGGSAVSAVNTLGGALDQLKNKWDNQLEAIGGSLSPTLQQLIATIDELIPTIGAGLNAVLETTAQLILGLIGDTTDWNDSLDQTKETITTIFGSLQSVTVGVAAVWKGLQIALAKVIQVIVDGLDLIFGSLGRLLDEDFTIGRGFSEALQEQIDANVKSFDKILGALNEVKTKAKETGTTVADAFKPDASKIPAIRPQTVNTPGQASFMSGVDLFRNIQLGVFASPQIIEQQKTTAAIESLHNTIRGQGYKDNHAYPITTPMIGR